MMISLTLDTNCLVDVDENRPAATFILELVRAADQRTVSLAMVASSASEQMPGGKLLSNFADFQDRMKKLGLGSIGLLKPIGKFDVSFYDWCLAASDEMIELEREIFTVLFPSVEPEWSRHAESLGIAVTDFSCPQALKWRNKLLDAQAFWAHQHYARDAFVTSDRNFPKRLGRHPKFSSASIITPEKAVALVGRRNTE